jgi:hypothetical protein
VITGIDLIGIYAAIVATIAIAWRIIEWSYDRARLRLKVSCVGVLPLPKRQPGCSKPEPGKNYLEVKAINVGRRPITLSTAGVDAGYKILYRGTTFPDTGLLPCRLEPGESISIHYDWERLRSIIRNLALQPVSVYIVDSTERVYDKRIPSRVRQWLNADISAVRE